MHHRPESGPVLRKEGCVLKLVVTGSQRSGTHWIARVYGAMGYRVCHEGIFSPRAYLSMDQVDVAVSWMAAPFVDELPSSVKVLHQLRNPLDVVRSLVGIRFFDESVEGHEPYRAPVRYWAPEVFQGSEIEQACRYWVSWNRLCERKSGPYERYWVEDVSVPWELPRNSRRRDESIQASDLMPEVWELAEEYGLRRNE